MKTYFRRIFGTWILLVLIAVIGAGCGDSIAENVIEKAAGVEVEQAKDGALTVTSKDGEVTFGGESGRVPENFPLPIYKGAKVDSSMTSKEQNTTSYIVSISTSDSLEKLADYYIQELKDLGITAEKLEIKDESGTMIFLNGKSDKLDASLQIYNGEQNSNQGNIVNLLLKVNP